jgi:hypothetical protein
MGYEMRINTDFFTATLNKTALNPEGLDIKKPRWCGTFVANKFKKQFQPQRAYASN